MGKQLQTRKNTQPSLRTSRSRSSRQNPARKSKSSILANSILKKHWDHELNARQNYRRMGLLKKVNGRIDPHNGRVVGLARRDGSRDEVLEKTFKGTKGRTDNEDGNREVAPIAEMKVVRDPVSGAILEVVGSEKTQQSKRTAAERTWYATGNSDEESSDEDTENKHVAQTKPSRLADELEYEAAEGAKAPSAATQRKLNPREREWCARMVAKHGVKNGSHIKCDWNGMCRDGKMNVYQLSKGQMKSKIKRYIEE